MMLVSKRRSRRRESPSPSIVRTNSSKVPMMTKDLESSSQLREFNIFKTMMTAIKEEVASAAASVGVTEAASVVATEAASVAASEEPVEEDLEVVTEAAAEGSEEASVDAAAREVDSEVVEEDHSEVETGEEMISMAIKALNE